MSATVRAINDDLPSDPNLPRAFGGYLLFDRIGRGGMAEIYLARAQMGLGGSRHVVVKQVLPHLSDDPGFAQMLIAEAKLAAELRHGNIVQIIDLGREAERLYITMEYVEGFDLHQLLRELSRKRLPLPAEFAFLIVREILSALDYAHRATSQTGEPMGIVHRDVSPSNVLISFEGEVKLCDFGIARASTWRSGSALPSESVAAEEASRIQRARVAGKSAYMAPEHARGYEIDARADLFAAGVLLWELCAGRRLYKGTEAEMLALAKAGAVPPLPERGLPQHLVLQRLLAKALASDPASRFQSAGEALAELDAYLVSARLQASQLRFSGFLMEHFAEQIVDRRRARERAAEVTLGRMSIPGRASSSAGEPVGGTPELLTATADGALVGTSRSVPPESLSIAASAMHSDGSIALPALESTGRRDGGKGWLWWLLGGAVAVGGTAAALHFY